MNLTTRKTERAKQAREAKELKKQSKKLTKIFLINYLKIYTMIQYKKFTQNYIGGKRTIYSANVEGATYHTDSLKRLKELIKTHKKTIQGTF